ncbi:lamin tail domain-containing protein, partial [Algoriphagus sp.]
MLSLFFIWQLLFFTVFSVKDISQADLNRQTQDFESVFAIQNYPNEFLTGWFGNEIRATSSRIYPANGLGRNGSKALAVQPISTFDGEIVIRLAPGQFTDPQVKFWARSVKNGSGDRSALVSYRWGEQLDGDYSVRETLGEPDEFENEDQEFRLFAIELPKGLQEAGEVYLKLEIRYGPGIGSCAKWLMDDFEFGEFVEDTAAPKIKNVRGFDEREIEIQFDEELDPVFSEFILNYKLDGIEPLEAKRKSDSLVYLTFEVKLENGRNYQLEVLQIPDLEGNFLQDSLLNFQFFDPTFIPHKTLVINELMPAPKADLDLPNVEYVEIFHAGEYPIRLSGVSYANSRNRVVLGSEWVQPGEFLIFCSENQASLLRDYGRVIPVRNWPTLLNSGDQVSLRDDQGKLIDVISYTTGSWAGSDFASGGYSLEVPNPFYPCDQSSLLKASVDLLRGTPGRENSVLSLAPDVSLLSLISAEFLTEKSLLLTFSKPVLVGLDQSNFGFDPNLSIDSLFVVKSNQIQIFLENEVSPNTIYTLQINGVFDCFGNQFVQDEVIRLVLPLQAQIGEVWINELLFNPKTGSPKFIELVNVSDSYVEVKDWMLANKDEFGEVDQLKQLSETSVIIPPKGFLAITTNTDQLKLDFPKSSFGQFTKIKALPSYP